LEFHKKGSNYSLEKIEFWGGGKKISTIADTDPDNDFSETHLQYIESPNKKYFALQRYGTVDGPTYPIETKIYSNDGILLWSNVKHFVYYLSNNGRYFVEPHNGAPLGPETSLDVVSAKYGVQKVKGGILKGVQEELSDGGIVLLVCGWNGEGFCSEDSYNYVTIDKDGKVVEQKIKNN
jgi:hypothetical protein